MVADCKTIRNALAAAAVSNPVCPRTVNGLNELRAIQIKPNKICLRLVKKLQGKWLGLTPHTRALQKAFRQAIIKNDLIARIRIWTVGTRIIEQQNAILSERTKCKSGAAIKKTESDAYHCAFSGIGACKTTVDSEQTVSINEATGILS